MFKYYKISDHEALEKIIGNKPTLKFTSVYKLNDPYELKFNLSANLDDPIHRERFLSKPGVSEQDYESWKTILNRQTLWYPEQMIRNDVAQNFNLCSLSKIRNNNLMWSHYTDIHKGICVEYDKLITNELSQIEQFISEGAMTYSKKPPFLKSEGSLNEMVNSIFFYKQAEWKYEKEYRIIIKSQKSEDYIPISRKFIKSVIIGSNTPSEFRKLIIELCKNTSIKLYWAITLGDSYEISFKEYSPTKFYSRGFW